MPRKARNDNRPQSSSKYRTALSKKPASMPDARTDELSADEMEAILMRARQTVKPIVKREATNELVTEEILNFKMDVA